MKKRLCILAIILTFILTGSACTSKQVSESAKTKVGTWKTAQTIQPFFYKDFIHDSYDLEVLPFTNPGDQKSALLAGDLDICGTTIAMAITAASKGEPVVVVCGLSNKCSAIVVKEDSDINTPEDLKGKKIAYVPGTMHHVLLLETLDQAGLDPQKDVELMRIDFFDMGQALSQGAIDAFCSGEPYPALATSEGYGCILTYPYYEEDMGTINSGMLTTVDKIKNDREQIQALVTAHAKSTEYLKKETEAWLKTAADFGTYPEVLKISADNIELFWDIDSDYVRKAENLAKRMKELGMISQIPDMNSLFDFSFVEQARKDILQ